MGLIVITVSQSKVEARMTRRKCIAKRALNSHDAAKKFGRHTELSREPTLELTWTHAHLLGRTGYRSRCKILKGPRVIQSTGNISLARDFAEKIEKQSSPIAIVVCAANLFFPLQPAWTPYVARGDRRIRQLSGVLTDECGGSWSLDKERNASKWSEMPRSKWSCLGSGEECAGQLNPSFASRLPQFDGSLHDDSEVATNQCRKAAETISAQLCIHADGCNSRTPLSEIRRWQDDRQRHSNKSHSLKKCFLKYINACKRGAVRVPMCSSECYARGTQWLDFCFRTERTTTAF